MLHSNKMFHGKLNMDSILFNNYGMLYIADKNHYEPFFFNK